MATRSYPDACLCLCTVRGTVRQHQDLQIRTRNEVQDHTHKSLDLARTNQLDLHVKMTPRQNGPTMRCTEDSRRKRHLLRSDCPTRTDDPHRQTLHRQRDRSLVTFAHDHRAHCKCSLHPIDQRPNACWHSLLGGTLARLLCVLSTTIDQTNATNTISRAKPITNATMSNDNVAGNASHTCWPTILVKKSQYFMFQSKKQFLRTQNAVETTFDP